jgi:hypothetical protein
MQAKWFLWQYVKPPKLSTLVVRELPVTQREEFLQLLGKVGALWYGLFLICIK